MKANALAIRLNGMDLDDFPSGELNSEARRAGLVVVLGVSTDMVEFHGAITGEVDVPGGGRIYFDRDGILPDLDDVPEEFHHDYYDRKKFAVSIDAEWHKEDGFDWTFTMVPPHSRFVAHKDGASYCRGIIFDLYATGVKP